MASDSTTLFSIIICAQDRRKYLMSAIRSALNQSIPRENFEVIIVKNFVDEEIDAFAQGHGVSLLLVKDGPLAHKVADGIENSHGKYLCFLDDDDLFSANKLSRMNDFITRYGEFSYYRNSFIAIDESGTEIKDDISIQAPSLKVLQGFGEILRAVSYMIRYRADWYASTICVRKDLVSNRIDSLRKTQASTDKFLFLAGLSGDGVCVLDDARTTLYRMHGSLTTVVSNYQDFIAKKSDFYEQSRRSFEVINVIYNQTPIKEICEAFLVHEEVLAAFTGNKRSFSMIGKLPRVLASSYRYGFKSTLFWYVMLILRMVFGSLLLRLYYSWNNARISALTGSS